MHLSVLLHASNSAKASGSGKVVLYQAFFVISLITGMKGFLVYTLTSYFSMLAIAIVRGLQGDWSYL